MQSRRPPASVLADSWFDEQRIIGIFALCVATLLVALRMLAGTTGVGPIDGAAVHSLAVGLVSSLPRHVLTSRRLSGPYHGGIAALIVASRLLAHARQHE